MISARLTSIQMLPLILMISARFGDHDHRDSQIGVRYLAKLKTPLGPLCLCVAEPEKKFHHAN